MILINLSDETYEIYDGDRICQMIVSKYEKVVLIEKSNLNNTFRGDGGFGHTGRD